MHALVDGLARGVSRTDLDAEMERFLAQPTGLPPWLIARTRRALQTMLTAAQTWLAELPADRRPVATEAALSAWLPRTVAAPPGGAHPPAASGGTDDVVDPANDAGHDRRPPPPIRPAGPTRPVRVKGRADRIDRAPDGSLIIVDFKTGATVPSRAAVEQHAQLAVYQLALSLGAGRRLSGETGHPGGTADDRPGEAGRAAGPDTRLDGDGDGEGDGDGPVANRPGGAELVYLRSGTPTVRRQPALDEAAGQFWIEQLRQAAEFLAAPHSIAVENRSCERCPVRSSCPLQPSGRQVTR